MPDMEETGKGQRFEPGQWRDYSSAKPFDLKTLGLIVALAGFGLSAGVLPNLADYYTKDQAITQSELTDLKIRRVLDAIEAQAKNLDKLARTVERNQEHCDQQVQEQSKVISSIQNDISYIKRAVRQ